MDARIRRSWWSTSFVLALALASLAAAPPKCAGRAGIAARDWAVNPAIVVANSTGDLYALGDVHGDYDRLISLLAAAKIIQGIPAEPGQAKWAAGNAVLVCTGDLIDKGDHSLEVIAALRALIVDAARAGGRVIVTMGNHEAEFLANPNNKKTREFLDELKRKNIDPQAVVEGRDVEHIGEFLRALPFAARVNDWFFAHAGNTKGMTLETLKAALQNDVDRNGYGAKMLADDDSLLEARLKDHPWWEMSDDPDGAGEARLRRYVAALGAGHLVIGHQNEKVTFSDQTHRKKGQMFEKFDGLIFLIDVGMSRAIDASEGSILRVHEDHPLRATIIDNQGQTDRLWTAKPTGSPRRAQDP
jgi:hypothetical protein